MVQAIILVEKSSSSGKFMMTGGREEVEGGEGEGREREAGREQVKGG